MARCRFVLDALFERISVVYALTFRTNVSVCGQLVAGFSRWLNTHWRAAKVICLHFTGYPAEKD